MLHSAGQPTQCNCRVQAVDTGVQLALRKRKRAPLVWWAQRPGAFCSACEDDVAGASTQWADAEELLARERALQADAAAAPDARKALAGAEQPQGQSNSRTDALPDEEAPRAAAAGLPPSIFSSGGALGALRAVAGGAHVLTPLPAPPPTVPGRPPPHTFQAHSPSHGLFGPSYSDPTYQPPLPDEPYEPEAPPLPPGAPSDDEAAPPLPLGSLDAAPPQPHSYAADDDSPSAYMQPPARPPPAALATPAERAHASTQLRVLEAGPPAPANSSRVDAHAGFGCVGGSPGYTHQGQQLPTPPQQPLHGAGLPETAQALQPSVAGPHVPPEAHSQSGHGPAAFSAIQPYAAPASHIHGPYPQHRGPAPVQVQTPQQQQFLQSGGMAHLHGPQFQPEQGVPQHAPQVGHAPFVAHQFHSAPVHGFGAGLPPQLPMPPHAFHPRNPMQRPAMPQMQGYGMHTPGGHAQPMPQSAGAMQHMQQSHGHAMLSQPLPHYQPQVQGMHAQSRPSAPAFGPMQPRHYEQVPFPAGSMTAGVPVTAAPQPYQPAPQQLHDPSALDHPLFAEPMHGAVAPGAQAGSQLAPAPQDDPSSVLADQAVTFDAALVDASERVPRIPGLAGPHS